MPLKTDLDQLSEDWSQAHVGQREAVQRVALSVQATANNLRALCEIFGPEHGQVLVPAAVALQGASSGLLDLVSLLTEEQEIIKEINLLQEGR